jgi:hypothetical protein
VLLHAFPDQAARSARLIGEAFLRARYGSRFTRPFTRDQISVFRIPDLSS